jgi:hypothetical protein
LIRLLTAVRVPVGIMMKKPVHQLHIANPVAGIDAVLADLVSLDFSGGIPDRIAVAALDVSSERLSDIRRMTGNGRVFDRAGLREILENSAVRSGWFFFGAPGAVGEPVEPIDVPRLLEQSAFVIDVLDGRFLCARSVHQGIAATLRAAIVGAEEIEPRELEDVRLMY